MNKIRVECNSEKLMELADDKFTVVTHEPEEDSRSNYSGEFLVFDERSEDEIIEGVKELHDKISNQIV